MKLLSIAIPCYNSEKYMRKCIDSLLVGGEDVEILIVDDGSTKIALRRSQMNMKHSFLRSSARSTRRTVDTVLQ